MSSTTQLQLANGLVKRGHSVDVYSPGKCSGIEFTHHEIKRSSIRGIQSRSIVKQMQKLADDFNLADVALVDWTLFSIAKKLTIPVILIDRSPPADRGLLANLQWLSWKKAWKYAKKGTVVSKAHEEFVDRALKVHSKTMKIIPAGVDLDLFQPADRSGPIKLVYHGRVDVNRGVMSLPMILAGLHSRGIDATLHIHGAGDAVNRLRNIELEGLVITNSIDHDIIASKLSTYDVGLLPMPGTKVWSLASPLKRSEYLASGMVVCGIDHTGHQIEDSGDWLQLFTQREFITSTVDWIANLDRSKLQSLQKQSRDYAEENLSWSHSVDALESMILS